jgi:hypothetical protein
VKKNGIGRFKLGGRIRAGGGRKKNFQKRLAAGTEWATFSVPLRTGAPFFLLKDGLTGRRQKPNCVHAGPFSFGRSSFKWRQGRLREEQRAKNFPLANEFNFGDVT